MSLETNIDYKGYEYITPIFNAIINKSVVVINYEPFNKQEYQVTFHPYHLKQYNNRWFVFGLNEFNNMPQWNLALDRINGEITKINSKYIQDNTDWTDFFDDVIGVSKEINKKVEEVKLVFNKEQAPYIQTKPLHGSQKSKFLDDGSLEIRIKVILNYELEMRILSFGEKVKVVAPEALLLKIKERIKQQLNNY